MHAMHFSFCCKKYLNEYRLKHKECHCKDNFSIGCRPTVKKTQGLKYDTKYIKLKDTGGFQQLTSDLVQLTGYTLNIIETMLKEESLLKIFYECSIESYSALVPVKEFIFNKLKCMCFTKKCRSVAVSTVKKKLQQSFI